MHLQTRLGGPARWRNRLGFGNPILLLVHFLLQSVAQRFVNGMANVVAQFSWVDGPPDLRGHGSHPTVSPPNGRSILQGSPRECRGSGEADNRNQIANSCWYSHAGAHINHMRRMPYNISAVSSEMSACKREHSNRDDDISSCRWWANL
jgi:hypothetical protein